MRAQPSLFGAVLTCVCTAGIFAFAPSADAFAVPLPNANHPAVSSSASALGQRAGHQISPLMSNRRSAPPSSLHLSAEAQDSDGAAESIDTSADLRLTRVRLPRATTIEWGTDLSFSFVYVRAMEPAGAADLSGQVAVNDQLCE